VLHDSFHVSVVSSEARRWPACGYGTDCRALSYFRRSGITRKAAPVYQQGTRSGAARDNLLNLRRTLIRD
jgi:hypothetical protein